jgi:hypothetical protein
VYDQVLQLHGQHRASEQLEDTYLSRLRPILYLDYSPSRGSARTTIEALECGAVTKCRLRTNLLPPFVATTFAVQRLTQIKKAGVLLNTALALIEDGQ